MNSRQKKKALYKRAPGLRGRSSPLRFYNKLGRPISMQEWTLLLEDQKYGRIADTTVGPWRVSTVWLGLNHAFMPDMPKQIFESMIFGPEEEPLNERQRRYATLEEARIGHETLVAIVRGTLKQGRIMRD